MKVSVIHPQDLRAGDIEKWRELQRDEPRLASPFVGPEFAQAIGRARPDARVAVIEDGGASGYFPFQIDGAQGRPIGATICDGQAVVCPPEWHWDARELIRACGLDVWQFDHLAVHQEAFVPFHAARHRSPIIDLSEGHEHFLDAVRATSKDVVAQVARRRRKLGREVGPVTTSWHGGGCEELAALMHWKTDQYRNMGTWDRFEHDWIRRVLHDLVEPQPGGEEPAGALATTRAGDRLVAVHLGLSGTRSLSWWFPAYDPDLGRYSPGLIMLLDLAEQAAARGLSMIDLGRGEHSYKLRVATGYHEVAEGEVTAT